MSCPGCWPWNLPLSLTATRLTDGQMIGMRFEQWLLYHWHVLIHQRNPNGSFNWPGEFETKRQFTQ